MILYKRKSNPTPYHQVRLRDEPYLIINIVFAGVILLIMLYSGFFSPEKNNYPVVCIHEKLTGEPCISCGLSHSFSLIVRGRFEDAYQWNIYGMRVFLFFALQLIIRIVFSIFYIRFPAIREKLIITDSIGSGLFFIVSFWPYIVRIISDIL